MIDHLNVEYKVLKVSKIGEEVLNLPLPTGRKVLLGLGGGRSGMWCVLRLRKSLSSASVLNCHFGHIHMWLPPYEHGSWKSSMHPLISILKMPEESCPGKYIQLLFICSLFLSPQSSFQHRFLP